MIGAGEVLFLAGLVLVLFWLAGPLRRRLEAWIARRFRQSRPAQSRRVVVLERRRNGTFGPEDRDDR